MSSFPTSPTPHPPPRPRKGRALLVAALGVATMTYGGAQSGCGDNVPQAANNPLKQPASDAGVRDGGGSLPDGSEPVVLEVDGALPVSGNLGPTYGWEIDGSMPASGNLLAPPPTDAAVGDAGSQDAGDDASLLPVSGNLFAPPPQDAP